jgi:CheY-like chemotaxis protein
VAAVEQARSFSPQVVFTDHDQTKRDGYPLARQLRQLPGLEGVVVVAEIGYGAEVEDLLRARQAGYELLGKPYDPSQLLRFLDPTAGPSAV